MSDNIDLSGIKMIVTDMDGTFLKDDNSFHYSRFQSQLEKLKAKGIHFVVATGRQYRGTTHLFGDLVEDITFITDNGSFITKQNHVLLKKVMPVYQVKEIVRQLNRYGLREYVLSGRKHAYIDHGFVKEDFVNQIKHYYQGIRDINEGYETDDIFKLTIRAQRGEEFFLLKEIGASLEFPFVPVSSGYEFLDLISPEINKATAIRVVQDKYHVMDHEIAVFGDSNNDIEMLSAYEHSFAVDNAPETIKQYASFTALSNNKEGVLSMIDVFLGDEKEKCYGRLYRRN